MANDTAPFTSSCEVLDEHTHRYRLQRDAQPLLTGEVLERWRADEGFTHAFVDLLAASPFEGFFWETPALTSPDLERVFEFVLKDSRSLALLQPDAGAFAEPMRGPDVEDDVATFWNLGGDALLVAPCPVGPADAYPHLARFLRAAPSTQRRALWRQVALAVAVRLGAAPLWVSTSGLGVAWLHVRLDKTPKYYQHTPYRLGAR